MVTTLLCFLLGFLVIVRRKNLKFESKSGSGIKEFMCRT